MDYFYFINVNSVSIEEFLLDNNDSTVDDIEDNDNNDSMVEDIEIDMLGYISIYYFVHLSMMTESKLHWMDLNTYLILLVTW